MTSWYFPPTSLNFAVPSEARGSLVFGSFASCRSISLRLSKCFTVHRPVVVLRIFFRKLPQRHHMKHRRIKVMRVRELRIVVFP